MPQPPSPRPAADPVAPIPHDDASGYRDGLANEPAYVSGAGEAPALFAGLLAPAAIAAAEERYLHGYYQGQQDRQRPGTAAPGRPAEAR